MEFILSDLSIPNNYSTPRLDPGFSNGGGPGKKRPEDALWCNLVYYSSILF